MALIETWYNQDLKDPVQVQYLDGNIFSQDSRGNLIGVHVFEDGDPAVISGTVTATAIRADGITVPITGSISGNSCSVILPTSAYAVPGPIFIGIQLTGGGSTTTLCAIVTNVYQSSTDAVVDPGTIIPSISALITEIENVAATIPQDYSELSLGVDSKAAINDLLETALIPAMNILDQTGVTTSGKAWRANKGEVTGSQYMYITYSLPASYAENIVVIFGHGWGKPYPLVCFYDSNMDFISSAGWRGDTDYKGLPVVIPSGASTMVINGRTSSPFTVGVNFYNIVDFPKVIRKVGTFGTALTENLFTSNPDYADLRKLPTNCVYSIPSGLAPSMTNVPNELGTTYATVLKVNGGNSAPLDAGRAYNLYLMANENNFWVGFENNDALVWRLISSNAQPAKKYLFIGDSYGDGYSHDGNNSGWCEYLAQAMGLSSSQYESVHQGGSGFANAGFLARLNAAVGSGFTDIVVLGGFNDYNSTAADIATGISNFCSRAKTLFPNSTVYIGCVGWIKEGTGESAYQNWQEVRAAITDKVLPTYQACGKYGAKYVSFSEYLLTDDLMTNTDGYHPGEAGNKAIAQGLINGIATGCACLPFKSVLKS